MRILMINICCGTGSTGRICTDLAARLEEAGHEVKIAYARDGLPEWAEKYAVRIGTTADVLCHAASARLLDNAGFASRRATEKFLRWVREFDPDIIHLHNLHGYYIHVGLLFDYLKQSGKRVIWTLHDGWAFSGHSALCDLTGCTRWETGCHDCPQRNVYPQSFPDRSRQNWQKKKECFTGVPKLTIVTPSRWLADQVRRSFLGQYPVTVIPNGINTSVFRPTGSDFRKRHRLEGKRVLLGAASPFNEMKGFSDYLKLAQMLDDRYQVVLIGLTRRQISALPENILGLERTSSLQELACAYSAADLFVNLTHCDTYPGVNLEASACGTPVVTYATGGSPESAFLCAGVVEKGDIPAMADAIRAYFKTPKETATLSETDIRALDNRTAIAAYQALCQAQ